MRRITLGLVGLAAVLAACGGGTKTGTTGAQPTAAKPVSGSAAGSDYCKLAKTYQAKSDEFTKAFQNVDFSKPESFKAAFQKLIPQFKDAVAAALAVAPGEIKADLRLVSDAFLKYVTVLEKANYDFTKISPDDLKSLTDPKVQSAAQRLAKYGSDKCGIAVPAGIPS
jgi:ABC-type glycerol-3-phosphate transport system substrate-binding protein